MTIAHSTFILGGQRSGKSRRAELLARDWLSAAPARRAVMVATGQAWDEEMREQVRRAFSRILLRPEEMAQALAWIGADDGLGDWFGQEG